MTFSVRFLISFIKTAVVSVAAGLLVVLMLDPDSGTPEIIPKYICPVCKLLWSNEPQADGVDNSAIAGLNSECADTLSKAILSDGNGAQVTYRDMYQKIYGPRNFSVREECTVFPWLSLKRTSQYEPAFCPAIFTQWFQLNNGTAQIPPPIKMPEDLEMEFTLDGHVRTTRWYSNDVSQGKTLDWNRTVIEHLQSIVAAEKPDHTYPKYTKMVYNAAKSMDLNQKVAAVIGSLTPWLELILLKNGASRITTVEYAHIVSADPRIVPYHPVAVARKFLEGQQELFDVIASFSSIEHSGLGRYGDIIDPFSDVLEMLKIWCLLKPGGTVLLGFPMDRDMIAWNVHRIYGRLRLPMMTAGFDVVTMFDSKTEVSLDADHPHIIKPIFDRAGRAPIQYIMILKKV